jgi:hypothetical protein
VVSVKEKVLRKYQVRNKKMNESEQLMTCRKANQLTSKLGSVVGPGQIQRFPSVDSTCNGEFLSYVKS